MQMRYGYNLISSWIIVCLSSLTTVFQNQMRQSDGQDLCMRYHPSETAWRIDVYGCL